MSQPTWKIIWKAECTPDCLTGPWEVGKARGYFEEARGWAGWPRPSGRNDPPPSSAPTCQPHSPSLMLESAGENHAWGEGGTGEISWMCSCSGKKYWKPEKNLARAEPGSLSFLFEFSVLHSQHQPEEENVHFESNWHILEKGTRDVVLQGMRRASRNSNTSWMEGPVWPTLAVVHI